MATFDEARQILEAFGFTPRQTNIMSQRTLLPLCGLPLEENSTGSSTAGLVLVSCFPDRKTLRRFITDWAWETEVWIANEPTHLIHLDGSRLMGPYQKPAD